MSESELKQITELVVYRDLWVRGANPRSIGAALLNVDGMCCLGFACLASGVAARAMFDLAAPGDLTCYDDGIPGFSEWDEGGLLSTQLSIDAMTSNDSSPIDDPEREARLIELFAEDGIRLRFEDTAPEDLRETYQEGLPEE